MFLLSRLNRGTEFDEISQRDRSEMPLNIGYFFSKNEYSIFCHRQMFKIFLITYKTQSFIISIVIRYIFKATF